MNDFPFAAIGFDLDGTLLDTFRDLGAAVNHALEAGGFAPAPVDSKDLIGRSAKIMLKRAVDRQGGMADDEIHALYKQMLYTPTTTRSVRPVGRAGNARHAGGQGLMAVVTNKFEAFARCPDPAGMADRFVAIGSDTMGEGNAKPRPDLVIEARRACGASDARFAFVGDSTYGVNAASWCAGRRGSLWLLRQAASRAGGGRSDGAIRGFVARA